MDPRQITTAEAYMAEAYMIEAVEGTGSAALQLLEALQRSIADVRHGMRAIHPENVQPLDFIAIRSAIEKFLDRQASALSVTSRYVLSQQELSLALVERIGELAANG
jgi:hypothetical protein